MPASINTAKQEQSRQSVLILIDARLSSRSSRYIPGSGTLLGIADALIELKAVCECGRKATMNLRVDADGRAVVEGAQTEIGGNDRYVAMCRRHFMAKRRTAAEAPVEARADA